MSRRAFAERPSHRWRIALALAHLANFLPVEDAGVNGIPHTGVFIVSCKFHWYCSQDNAEKALVRGLKNQYQRGIDRVGRGTLAFKSA